MRSGFWGNVAAMYLVGAVPVAVTVAVGRRRRWAVVCALALALGSVLAMTMLPLAPRHGRLSLVPAVETIRLVRHIGHSRSALPNLVGNLILLMPVGAALGMLGLTLRRAVLTLTAIAIAVETMQSVLPLGRVAAIDDVVLNVLGSVAAYLACRRLRASAHER